MPNWWEAGTPVVEPKPATGEWWKSGTPVAPAPDDPRAVLKIPSYQQMHTPAASLNDTLDQHFKAAHDDELRQRIVHGLLDHVPTDTLKAIAGGIGHGVSSLLGVASVASPVSPDSRRDDFNQLADEFSRQGQGTNPNFGQRVIGNVSSMVPALATGVPAATFAGTAASQTQSAADAEDVRRVAAGLKPLTPAQRFAAVSGNAALMAGAGKLLSAAGAGEGAGVVPTMLGAAGLNVAGSELNKVAGVDSTPRTFEQYAEQAGQGAVAGGLLHGLGALPKEIRASIQARKAFSPAGPLPSPEELAYEPHGIPPEPPYEPIWSGEKVKLYEPNDPLSIQDANLGNRVKTPPKTVEPNPPYERIDNREARRATQSVPQGVDTPPADTSVREELPPPAEPEKLTELREHLMGLPPEMRTIAETQRVLHDVPDIHNRTVARGWLREALDGIVGARAFDENRTVEPQISTPEAPKAVEPVKPPEAPVIAPQAQETVPASKPRKVGLKPVANGEPKPVEYTGYDGVKRQGSLVQDLGENVRIRAATGDETTMPKAVAFPADEREQSGNRAGTEREQAPKKAGLKPVSQEPFGQITSHRVASLNMGEQPHDVKTDILSVATPKNVRGRVTGANWSVDYETPSKFGTTGKQTRTEYFSKKEDALNWIENISQQAAVPKAGVDTPALTEAKPQALEKEKSIVEPDAPPAAKEIQDPRQTPEYKAWVEAEMKKAEQTAAKKGAGRALLDKVRALHKDEAGAINTERPIRVAQTVAGAAADAAHYYGEELPDRLKREGGQYSAEGARLAREVIDKTKIGVGALSKDFDPAIEAVRKNTPATEWLNTITPSKSGDFGQVNARAAVEGRLEVPADAQKTLDTLKSANMALGKYAEKGATGFKASGLYQRMPTALYMDMLKGPHWEKLVDGYAEYNQDLSRPMIKDVIGEIRKEFLEGGDYQAAIRKMAQEHSRFFNNVPSAIKIGSSWEYLFHDRPFDYLTNANRQVVARSAFNQIIGADHLDALNKSIAGEGAKAHEAWKDTVTALHGLPLTKPLLDPLGNAGLIARVADRAMSSVAVPASLGTSAIGNVLEIVNRIPRQFRQDALTAVYRWKELAPIVEESGAINKAFMDWSNDPQSPVLTKLRQAKNILTTANLGQFLNEATETFAAISARVRSERMQQGKIGAWEKNAVIDQAVSFGFDREQAMAMAEGRGGPDLYAAYERAAAAKITGGNMLPAEGSRFSGNRTLSAWWKFQNYPIVQLRNMVSSFARLGEAVESGDNGRIASATAGVASNILGYTVSGLAMQGAFALLKGDSDGFTSELKDHPGTMLAGGLFNGIGGPASILYNAVAGQQSVGDTAINTAIGYPGSKIRDAYQAVTRTGQYRNLAWSDAAKLYAQNGAPISRTAMTTLSALGLADEYPRYKVARSAFYRAVPPQGSAAGDTSEWGIAMERLGKTVLREKAPAALADAIHDVIKSVGGPDVQNDAKKVEESLRGKKLLDSIPDGQEAAIKAKIGKTNWDILQNHDELLDVWAGAIYGDKAYKGLGELKVELNKLDTQKQAFKEARSKGLKPQPFDYGRLEMLSAAHARIIEVQHAVAKGKLKEDAGEQLIRNVLAHVKNK